MGRLWKPSGCCCCCCRCGIRRGFGRGNLVTHTTHKMMLISDRVNTFSEKWNLSFSFSLSHLFSHYSINTHTGSELSCYPDTHFSTLIDVQTGTLTHTQWVLKHPCKGSHTHTPERPSYSCSSQSSQSYAPNTHSLSLSFGQFSPMCVSTIVRSRKCSHPLFFH